MLVSSSDRGNPDMSLTDFFQYLSDDERTAALATQLADAFTFHRGTAVEADTKPGAAR
jgi:hypothetical protein